MIKSIAQEYLEMVEEIKRYCDNSDFADYVYDLNRQLSGLHQQMCDMLNIDHDGTLSGASLAKQVLRGQYGNR